MSETTNNTEQKYTTEQIELFKKDLSARINTLEYTLDHVTRTSISELTSSVPIVKWERRLELLDKVERAFRDVKTLTNLYGEKNYSEAYAFVQRMANRDGSNSQPTG